MPELHRPRKNGSRRWKSKLRLDIGLRKRKELADPAKSPDLTTTIPAHRPAVKVLAPATTRSTCLPVTTAKRAELEKGESVIRGDQ